MYEMCYDLVTPAFLNLTRVSYSRNVHTQQYTHGSRSWQEPVGYSWSDLDLEGNCDDLSAVFFNQLFPSAIISSYNFYIKEEQSNFCVRVVDANIIRWHYTDTEYRPDETFSLTFAVTDIQRIQAYKVGDSNEDKSKKKVKEKKIIIPERQIVICRIA